MENTIYKQTHLEYFIKAALKAHITARINKAQDEEFKACPAPYSRYKVSRKGIVKGSSGKILKPYVNNAGYSVLPATKDDGKSTTVPVQRIVATAWVNQPDTDKKLVVDHINDNKTDNRASNLHWVTYHDNLVKHHRMTTMSGEHSYTHGRAVIKISESGRKYYYKSLSAAARDNQMSVTSVSGSANGTLHLNKPFHFVFAK